MLKSWIFEQLTQADNCRLVIVRDPLGLTLGMTNDLNAWGKAHEFAVVPFATNLLFRYKLEEARREVGNGKLLLLDQTPLRRRQARTSQVASAPFYPDVLAQTPSEARVDLDLRRFLVQVTNDPDWPQDVNDPRYARLIARHLDDILQAHRGLRAAHPGRFTDHDFSTIVASAALGIADSAFKKLSAQDYWKIGLLGHDALRQLEDLVPEVTRPIREQLAKAPAPFCWFATHDPDLVLRVFYLAAILRQHAEQWNLLVGHVDPALIPLSGIQPHILSDAAPKLVAMDPEQAGRDLTSVEDGLSAKDLDFLLLEQLHVDQPVGFAAVLERERYSTLFRCLALLMALKDLLSAQGAQPTQTPGAAALAEHQRIATILFSSVASSDTAFIDGRSSEAWTQLKEAYRLASEVRSLQLELAKTIKNLKVVGAGQLTFGHFRDAWNKKRLNRLDYYLSALERLTSSAILLPRAEADLPQALTGALSAIRDRVSVVSAEVRQGLDYVDGRFQELVERQYPEWTKGQSEVRLTAHFLARCLKPHWDPKTERAAVLIFDGMRYDIWDELLRPLLADQMDLIAEYSASSLLPSETHITRKAISAGSFPDQFDTRLGEDTLLKAGLGREFSYVGNVDVLSPEGAGTGETVRYRAGNLDVYIFELCDKELHKVRMRTLPDGREAPSRPLAFIYEQHIRNILHTEVMAILRSLAPGTKVFITADHGFGPVGREAIWFDPSDLNEARDCNYLNCRLRVAPGNIHLPRQKRDSIITFEPGQLRMPSTEVGSGAWSSAGKSFGAIAFPRVGYSFSRQDSPYNPDAYSHGGISLGQLLIPMAVLQVKARGDSLLVLGTVTGPDETVEGEEVEFRMPLTRGASGSKSAEELRADVDASYAANPERFALPAQVIYVPNNGSQVVYRFRPDPDDASTEERRSGMMRRTLTITVSWRDGRRLVRKSATFDFQVRLNTERIVRRVGSLGSILGLMPKGANG